MLKTGRYVRYMQKAVNLVLTRAGRNGTLREHFSPVGEDRWDTEPINSYEFQLFSQHGEDGILEHVFDEIGFSSKTFVEFGFGAIENNTLRLALKEGLGGLYIDGSLKQCTLMNTMRRVLLMGGVKVTRLFLTRDNLEPTIRQAGLSGSIDILSIDVDGNDFWFWQAIECVSPRLVVIEYNASLGPELSLTVPYDPAFERLAKHESGFYCGASLRALTRLASRKGYRLIGCDSCGVNAFFLRNDVYAPGIRTREVEDAFRPHRWRLEHGFSIEEQYKTIADLPYVEVERNGSPASL